jgi:hypothetical protein
LRIQLFAVFFFLRKQKQKLCRAGNQQLFLHKK